jgi:hypothetical protein
MADKAFHTLIVGQREFTLGHAEWIDSGMVSDTYSFRDVLKCEDMFLRSEVSTEEDMKVSGISRLWERNGKEVITETKTEVGLWKASPGVFDWATKVGNLIKTERDHFNGPVPRKLVADIYLNNREAVADDPLIIAKLQDLASRGIPTDSACIITQDRKLCKTASAVSGLWVARLSTYAMPLIVKDIGNLQKEIMSYEGEGGYISELSIPEQYRIGFTIVDTGSLDEMLMKHDLVDIGDGGKKTYRYQSSKFFLHRGKRKEVFTYIPIKGTGKTLSDLRSMKDPNGHPMFEWFKPEHRALRKLPKFNSYAKGSSASSNKTNQSSSSQRRVKDRRRAMSEKQ